MNNDEQNVKRLLETKGFEVISLDKEGKNSKQTPDFQANKNGMPAFYCEVKSVAKDEWLDNQLESAPPLTVVGGSRPDPVFNKLSSKIHEAVSQFDCINPSLNYPNVLIFVNHNNEGDCGIFDLRGVVTGLFEADNGKAYPIYAKYSEGRIKDEKFRIHLYVWITNNNEEYYIVNENHKEHFDNLCNYFNIDPNKIKRR